MAGRKRPFQAAELARIRVTERRGNECGGLQATQGIEDMSVMRGNREDARRQVPVLQWLKKSPSCYGAGRE